MKITERELRKLYSEDLLTDEEIGDLYGIKQPTVWYYRKKFGIASIQKWERHDCSPTFDQYQILYGTILGDSSFSDGKKKHYQCNSCFSVMHCEQQKDLVLWKYEWLKSLCTNFPKPTRKNAWWFKTIHHPFFSELRKSWYPDGRKSILRENLNLITDSKALAVWYMDDGTLQKKKFAICTMSFTEQEHEFLIEWLRDRFGVNSRMSQMNGYNYLKIDSSVVFCDLINKFIIPSMQYKLI